MSGFDDQRDSTGSGTPTSSVPLGDNGQSAAIVQQARSGAGGFQYGSDRAIGSPPNWASQESTQLYQGATVNNDPASAEATGQVWKGHGDELHQAANDLYNAITELGSAWVGHGAGAAQGALVGIANSSQQAGDAAHTMSSRMVQQAAAAAEVKKMPAPKEFDPAKQTAAMLAGGPAAMVADMKQQADEAKSVHAQQVQYFNAYTQAMSEVDNSTPSFGPDSLGLPPDGTFGATKASSVSGPGSMAGAPAVGSLGPAPGMQLGGVDSSGGASAFGAHLGAVGQAGGPAGVGGAAGGPVPAGPGVVSGAGVAPAAQTTPVPTSSSGGGAALGVGLGLAGAGLGAAAGKAALGRGSKTGAKQNPDETAAASTDQAQQQGHSAAANAPQGPVVSPNGTIGGGNTPPPGMGGMGGAGAQGGEEDKEHTRASYLVEADPDEAFGANVATAPPVIGAWSDEDEE
ncbi:hypothetical protein LWP59_36360 [Amycolatopsis acidiphila]|uniref:PPE domain-containing protein n=1 Tax=Amycolatopsis acidiphila TaxID=715473 RepID=A0A557ZRX1_9PSEU|nr:hypothetical protein [Amycolatopsis acidiphila]TVT14767.1 hypothetical protein FNH06_37210 [Amycolatopsis acidiphila]UIJ59451.1 hypothetical protein LWP59_36360 [Amycolatopsis acidiphila]GHG94565.1 hypothetical protein GCM10017788_72490 [Amycolatopsis acidiphila]